MPRGKGNASSTARPVEPEKQNESEKPVDSDERVDLDVDNDPEEVMEEDVEYEEVEEEEEVEEIEEVEEEEEEEEVEEEEVEEEDVEGVEDGGNNDNGINAQNENGIDEDEKKKHDELLALPPHGSEVYIGGIPQDTSEEDLRSFCVSIGEVTEVRIMKSKDSNENKGFAFVTYKSVELASKAIDGLNNTEFKGKKIKCSSSQAKHRLFMGNVPRSWGEEDLRKVVMDIGPGVTAVELVKDMKNTSNNRGFAFIDYYNHACAEYSRQKMMNPKFKLDDNAPTVSWADPKNADSSAASQVKAVYVKNLPKTVTQEQLKKLFDHHGKITKVVLPPAKSGQEKNRIGFVHFSERSSAMKALKNTEKYELDGQVLECSLAKPQADQKSGGSNSQKSGLLPNYPPRVGYGFVGGAYGAVNPGYGASGFGQPLIYGRGPTPAGMAMMPMLLPDGRIGYVLQQPGSQMMTPPPHPRSGGGSGSGSGGGSGSKSGGSSSRGGRHTHDSGHGRRYRPY
ncbi:heterogeneous nuclear ribonucleoprotein Q-like [Cucurbita moschata]|uniref:Heterogeneous nuclear ribonucleoprotein Q-like n=1 Tax=Cucurbita moschata TaxID=3662 RepID=A0A6J1H0I9_CUCMO|nr:heterogeneous nuclear ribonucleoprotein Q-like [Cucurbita moschata]XP_022957932.1 heterogeneous nuclear ribonucleoprotein Q-like [Cucurbita moschata]XP_022957933.1 heterogeneous nuclear ribonucleoprotein Q-like [Cucurbita moschata]